MLLLNSQNKTSNFIGNLAVITNDLNSPVFIVWHFNEKYNSVVLVELSPYKNDFVLVLDVNLKRKRVSILEPLDISERIKRMTIIDKD